jgi:hypothetical protein
MEVIGVRSSCDTIGDELGLHAVDFGFFGNVALRGDAPHEMPFAVVHRPGVPAQEARFAVR